MKVILASKSPRREELLSHLFTDFMIIPAQGEEKAVFTTPEEYVRNLATDKAKEIAERLSAKDIEISATTSNEDILVIGADTIVYADSQVLGKPKNTDDAYRMLSLLSGTSHYVYTGVCCCLIKADTPSNLTNICDALEKIRSNESSFDGRICRSFAEKTEVFVDTLSPEEIRAYIATGDPLDKAGSYGIQGVFSKHITHINGDYFNVVGLPVSRIYRELRDFLPK